MSEMPPCSRCQHPIEVHARPLTAPPPGEPGKPWPCTRCDCPGFVVSQSYGPENPSPSMPDVD